MPNSDSSRQFVDRLNAVTKSSFEEIDRRYRQRLCSLVEKELSRRFAGREDPEDAVQSALRSFFRGVRDKRLHIDHSCGLWNLLAKIARYKVLKHVEHHQASKRSPEQETQAQENALAAHEATPEEAAELADLLQQLTRRLEPAEVQILHLRLQGFSKTEIAKEVSCSQGIVRYRLEKIRELLTTILSDKSNRQVGGSQHGTPES